MNEPFHALFTVGLFDSKVKFSDLKTSPLRTVEDYEIEVYFEKGGTSYINGLVIPVKRGNIIVSKPGDKRKSDLHFRCYFIHVVEMSKNLRNIIDKLPTFMKVADTEELEECFKKMTDYTFSADEFSEVYRMNYLFELLVRLDGLRKAPQNEKNNSVTELAEKYIAKNFAKDISAEKIAENCYVSVSYLYRIFSEKLKISPHDMILNYRIAEAKNRLTNSTESVENIAKACGFGSLSYFSECFRRRTGVSPSVFRRESIHLP